MSGDPANRSELYRVMRTIRRFEERVVELVNANEIAGVTHESIGQEGVAAGVCSVLRRDDVITSTHRGHGHVIAKGVEPRAMMAELLGRIAGTNRGRGGSMHIADLSLGIFGANGMVAAGVPFAAGAAWAAKQRGEPSVAVAFFGDGALNQGVLHETMNLASIWSLPVVFVCENNGYAVTTASGEATAGSPVKRAEGYDMVARKVDGMDAEVVQEVTADIVERARAGGGPAFLECRTYRFVGHHTAERAMRLTYRSEDEIDAWRERDPLTVVGERLPAAEKARIDGEVESVLDEAVAFARASDAPGSADALDHVYASGLRPRVGVSAR